MKYIAALITVLVLGACQMAKFDRYPGKVQSTFPQSIRGTYYFVVPAEFASASSGIKAGDTVLYVITEKSVSVIDTSGKKSTKSLGKNQVLTLVEDEYYVISNRDSDYDKYWNCMIYIGDKKALHIYPLIDETRKSNLGKYFQREFIELNESKDSVFGYKMDDAAFARYFKKELKSDPIKLKRLR
jgi:hypothetical protein